MFTMHGKRYLKFRYLSFIVDKHMSYKEHRSFHILLQTIFHCDNPDMLLCSNGSTLLHHGICHRFLSFAGNLWQVVSFSFEYRNDIDWSIYSICLSTGICLSIKCPCAFWEINISLYCIFCHDRCDKVFVP